MTLYLREDFEKKWKNRDAFAEANSIQGEVFREVKGRRTLRFDSDGKTYFIKVHPGVGWLEIVKNLLTLRKPILGAENEWRAITALQSLNIPTMNAAAYGKRGSNPAKQFSFLITDELKPVISLEDVCAKWRHQRPDFVFKYRLLMEVARLSQLLHTNGICHRDFYLCHFLMRTDADGSINESGIPHLSIIDLHRALIRPAFLSRWIEKDIAGLYFSALDIGLTRTDLFRFIKAYSGGPLREALNQQADFWAVVKNKAEKVRLRDLHKKERRLQKRVYRESADVIRQQSVGQLTLSNRHLWTAALQPLIDTPDELMHAGTMLKDGDSTTVVSVTLDGKEWVIKRYNLKNFAYALSRLLRPSRAWHCWGSAFRFIDAGIQTPTPLLMLEKRWGPLRRQAYFVTERVDGQDVLRELEFEAPDSPLWRQTLILFSALFQTMYEQNIVHGDMKATNFILSRQINSNGNGSQQSGSSEKLQLQVLDLDATRMESSSGRFQKYFNRDLRRFYANWQHHEAAGKVSALVEKFRRF